MALYVVRGSEGRTWPLAEVRSLLQLAGRSFKLSKPYSWHAEPVLKEFKSLEAEVAAAAAARPGARRLPQIGSLGLTFEASSVAAACDACGQQSLKLRRCAACKSRSYW